MIRRAGVLGLVQGFAASAALAATIVVNDAGDALHDGPGQCAVSGTGVCTLRDALTFANSATGTDTIQFSIAVAAGPHAIVPTSSLPAISDPTGGVTIDGYSQPGAAPNTLPAGDNARILIELDCSLIRSGPGGCLHVTSSNNRIQGLSIHSTPITQIWINAASNNVVTGNFIGTDPTWTHGFPAGGDGVLILQGAAANRVGGSLPADRNLISGNWAVGVQIESDGNVVEGNLIGLAADGRTPLPNNRGILIYASANRIGGPNPGQGNVISASTNHGLTIGGDAMEPRVNNVVQGNLIGTDSIGQAAVPNRGFGIVLFDGVDNLVGGSSPGAGNVISGNALGGIVLADFDHATSGNVIQANRIGTDAAASHPIPNMGYGGLFVVGGVLSTQVGSPEPGAGNIIAYNAGPGIALLAVDGGTGPPVGCEVRGNAIYGNTDLGVDLGNDGVTENDACDGDTGPNGLQNFPVLASAVAQLDRATIRGTLNSTPATTFTLDFYANLACDPSGFGQGQTFLGSATVTTDDACKADFVVTLPIRVPVENQITATATDPAGNTSESSACVTITRSAPTFAVPVVP